MFHFHLGYVEYSICVSDVGKLDEMSIDSIDRYAMICLDVGFKYVFHPYFLAYKKPSWPIFERISSIFLIVRIDSISLWLRVVSWFSLWFLCDIHRNMWGINWTHISIEPWVPAPMIEKEFLPVAKPPDATVPFITCTNRLGWVQSKRHPWDFYVLSCVNRCKSRLHDFLLDGVFHPESTESSNYANAKNGSRLSWEVMDEDFPQIDFGTDGSPLTHGWRKPGWPLRKSQKASIHKIII